MKNQIKKMAHKMCRNHTPDGKCASSDEFCDLECSYGCCAERLYCADYRKQSEVASEIFWEIDKILTAIYLDDEDGTNFVGVDIQKYHALKKKYMKIKTERKQ